MLHYIAGKSINGQSVRGLSDKRRSVGEEKGGERNPPWQAEREMNVRVNGVLEEKRRKEDGRVRESVYDEGGRGGVGGRERCRKKNMHSKGIR